MNQSELFKKVAKAGGGGYAIGQSLPAVAGILNDIQVIKYDADKGPTISGLVNFMIEFYRQRPKMKLEERARQLGRLIEEAHKEFQYIVLIIKNAAALPPKQLGLLKNIREITDPPTLGIILLGDPAALDRKFLTAQSIGQRMFRF